MSAADVPTRAGFLERERIVARPGFSRWLVPPAALAIHLCIGMAYGFSVFWLPLSKAIGITKPVACPATAGLLDYLTTTSCDWKVALLQSWIYGLFFVFLGSSAALWGGWLERVGPRKAGIVAAFCWCGGILVMAFGVAQHQLWIVWLGAALGDVGLGLGYISPVSTLIKWFPDRRGMATGMAIMGFGGGAMIGAPLADRLMKHFASPTSVGVTEALLVLAAIYFVFMMGGALGYRVPPENWKPAGWNPDSANKPLITTHQVHLNVAWRTPQFWLLWSVLMLNVSAGIGILSMASPLLQEVFAGRLIGVTAAYDQLTPAQLASIAAIAAGFTGLLSLFNILGAHFLGLAVRSHRTQSHLHGVLPARNPALFAHPLDRGGRVPRTVRAVRVHHPVDVWRRLRHDPGLSLGPLRHKNGGRHTRAAADRLVDRRGAGSAADRLPPPVPAGPRGAEGTGVQLHDVHPRRAPGVGVPL
jgi:MFS family permease